MLRRFDANGDFYNLCTIKDISKDKHECLVFVEETGEKIFVPYTSLKPLTSANYPKLEESYNVQNLSRRFYTYNDRNQQLSIKSYKHQETSYKRDKFSSKYSSSVKCGIEIDRIADNFEPFVRDIMAMPMMIKNAGKTEPRSKTDGDGDKKFVVLKGMAANDPKSTPEENSNNFTFLQDTEVKNDSPDLQKILGSGLVRSNAMQFSNGTTSPFEGKQIDRIVFGTNVEATGKVNYNATMSEKADGSDLPSKFESC